MYIPRGRESKLTLVAQAYDLSIQEAEIGGSQIWGQSGYIENSRLSLGFLMRLVFKNRWDILILHKLQAQGKLQLSLQWGSEGGPETTHSVLTSAAPLLSPAWHGEASYMFYHGIEDHRTGELSNHSSLPSTCAKGPQKLHLKWVVHMIKKIEDDLQTATLGLFSSSIDLLIPECQDRIWHQCHGSGGKPVLLTSFKVLL